jgi:hypothetical protein
MACARPSRIWLLVLTGLTLLPPDVFAQDQEKPPPLPDYLQAAIPDAINRGTRYLQSTQTATGTWATEKVHVVGYAALPALTLLECGVPANDPGVQAAANFVRASVKSKEFTSTYEVSLALLFLDRLGDKKDKAHIETLAGRLIASQTFTGGWGYQVQYLNDDDTKEVLKLIKALEREPLPLDHLLAGRVQSMDNPFVKRAPVSESDLTPKRTVKLPQRWQLLPCFTQFGTAPLKDPPDTKGNPPPFLSPTDNSTTQFALLALWAARRHGIPCTRTGAMTFMRFHTSQNADGSWGYPYRLGGSGGSPAMINTGLLGMAIGHGIVREMGLKDDPPVDEDPRILQAFKAVGGHIGEPLDKVKDVPYPNLYFLWSLERVCMLYNVHLVGKKDWYRWGAEALVANQDPENGHWFKKDNFPGASPTIDTSFALMFLKRANLAKDLSAYLTFSPKKLNEGVTKLMPVAAKPAPPQVVEKKPEPAPEPPTAKPEPAPMQVAEAKPAQPPPTMPAMQPPTAPAAQPQPTPAPPAGGGGWWIWLLVGLGALLILGGVLFFFLMSGASTAGDEDEEEDRPRKKNKNPRRR